MAYDKKIFRWKIILLVLAQAFMFCLCGCSKKDRTSTDVTDDISVGYGEHKHVTDSGSYGGEAASDKEKDTNSITDKGDPAAIGKHYIDMELIYQYPELPTGCESVSLTMILNYMGFDISKTEIAARFLKHSDDNYVVGFVGNPFYSWGYGCYAPGMTDTANAFLGSRNSKQAAFNITGAPLDELFEYVSEDIPVLIWGTCGNTIHYTNNNKEGKEIVYNGTTYDWTSEEHCMVLTGYNKENNTVTLHDPIYGIVTIDKDMFEKVYDYMYRMAVIIK